MSRAARFLLTPQARADLLEIWNYIAEDSPEDADRVLERLYVAFTRLAQTPGMGHHREDLAGSLTEGHIGLALTDNTGRCLISVLHVVNSRRPRWRSRCRPAFTRPPGRTRWWRSASRIITGSTTAVLKLCSRFSKSTPERPTSWPSLPPERIRRGRSTRCCDGRNCWPSGSPRFAGAEWKPASTCSQPSGTWTRTSIPRSTSPGSAWWTRAGENRAAATVPPARSFWRTWTGCTPPWRKPRPPSSGWTTTFASRTIRPSNSPASATCACAISRRKPGARSLARPLSRRLRPAASRNGWTCGGDGWSTTGRRSITCLPRSKKRYTGSSPTFRSVT
ncbi:MAG: type II toxin-antitoxin system RelE/ParE family toxin [Bryobacteraceae bacterium]|nr:type II toxin-antitoxin system RelE/ParE family toxin [Bryobacteraceae bacterium]